MAVAAGAAGSSIPVLFPEARGVCAAGGLLLFGGCFWSDYVKRRPFGIFFVRLCRSCHPLWKVHHSASALPHCCRDRAMDFSQNAAASGSLEQQSTSNCKRQIAIHRQERAFTPGPPQRLHDLGRR